MKRQTKRYKLGRHIQKIRKEKGHTQETFAELVDISSSYISQIEIGGASPSLKLLFKMARRLGVRVKDLIPF